MSKLVVLENLQQFWNGIKDLVNTKVSKENGKGLSTNDLTHTLKGNYDNAYSHSMSAHAPVGAQVNVIEVIKQNGAVATITDKSVNITIPTKLSELSNAETAFITKAVADLTNYYTKSQTDNLLSSIATMSLEVVSTLPTTNIKTNIIYLIPKTGSGDDVYDEFIRVGTKWEKIGNTQIDLSSYLNTLTTSGTGNAVTSITKTGNVLTIVYGKTFSESGHTHNYAGSDSAGGAANSAKKLNQAVNIGNATFDGSKSISLTDMGLVEATDSDIELILRS